MAWVKQGSLKGPKGDAATTEQAFLAAHPVGCVYESTSAASPATTYGGTWTALPSLDGYKWKRTG